MNKNNLLKLKKNLLATSLVLTTSLAAANVNKKDVFAENINTKDNKIEENQNNRPATLDEAIQYYCNVFELKYDVVRAKMYEMIEPYAWHYGTSINGVCYDSVEQAALFIIRDMYNNPEDYDLTYEEISSGIPYEPSMKPEEMIYKYSKLYGINKDIALSIAYCECGTDMDSDNYLSNNNPAGIGPYYHFLNKETGIIYFCDMLKYDYRCSENSDSSFLDRIAGTYCEVPDHWLSLTLPLYYAISNDYLYYVDNRDEYDVDDYDTPVVNKLKRHK